MQTDRHVHTNSLTDGYRQCGEAACTPNYTHHSIWSEPWVSLGQKNIAKVRVRLCVCVRVCVYVCLCVCLCVCACVSV